MVPRQTIQYHSNPSLCPTTNTEEVEQLCYEKLQDLLELAWKNKRCPSYHRGLERKSRKSRNTWSNRKVWPWSTRWYRAKANRVLPREYTSHSKHPLSTTKEYGHHQMANTKTRLIIFFTAKDEEALYSQQKQDLKLWLISSALYGKIQA